MVLAGVRRREGFLHASARAARAEIYLGRPYVPVTDWKNPSLSERGDWKFDFCYDCDSFIVRTQRKHLYPPCISRLSRRRRRRPRRLAVIANSAKLCVNLSQALACHITVQWSKFRLDFLNLIFFHLENIHSLFLQIVRIIHLTTSKLEPPGTNLISYSKFQPSNSMFCTKTVHSLINFLSFDHRCSFGQLCSFSFSKWILTAQHAEMV